MRVRYYREDLTIKSRQLRKRQTDAEKVLWNSLRGRQLHGVKFQRQFAIGTYIVDFIAREYLLIIELDGSHHLKLETKNYDQERTKFLESHGYKVLRFLDNEVLTNLNGVLEEIGRRLDSHPSPLSGREGD